SFSDSARTERLVGRTAGVARTSRWSISWCGAPVLAVDEWPRSAAFATRRQELLSRFLTRLREQPPRFSTTFDRPWLHAARTVADVMAGDDFELHHSQFPHAGCRGVAESVPRGGDRLHRTAETDLPRQFAMQQGRLGDALAGQVVGQPGHPD